ncbi:MAG: hypothetical protein MK515_10860 [SAR324 cluster bacterium]|jgi:hypothetical protein|nr:hypothetical protein [SAR324 cluster bacterium]MCH2266949.1 hypothetical protein [SAR324 cluster bacterium]
MINSKTLFIFLAKQTIWFSFAGKRHCLKPTAKPLSPEKIMELCREWNASRVVLFLEFPWVLTHFEVTITLSPDELVSYANMRLGFQDFPESEVQSPPQKQRGNSNLSETPVGGIYFKQAQLDRVGLLCATLSAESLSLKKMFKQKPVLSVEIVPLIVACLPLLMKNSENSLIFKGLEQSFYLEKKDGFLTKFVELPSFGNVSQELFVADQLPLNTKPQTFRLIPEATPTSVAENKTETEQKNNPPEPGQMQNGIAIESVLTGWKGLARTPKSGFWWASSKNIRRFKKVGSWWNLVVALILIVVVGTGIFYFQTLNQREVLQQELSSLEQELEKHILNSPSRNYAFREKHLELLEELAKELVQEAFWKHQTLQTLLSSIEGAWLEGFEFNERKLRLELLALEPIDAVDLFLKLSNMPETVKVHFKSQQKTKLKGHELIRFKLLIELAHPAKTNQPNLNNK